MTVEDVIADRLAGDAAVIALVGTRIYMLKLPQRPTLPAIRVQLIDDPERKHLRGPNQHKRARVQVDAYAAETSGADPYAGVSSVANAINDALVFEPFDNGSPLELTVNNCERVDRRPMYEPDELNQVRMLQDYLVSYRDMT